MPSLTSARRVSRAAVCKSQTSPLVRGYILLLTPSRKGYGAYHDPNDIVTNILKLALDAFSAFKPRVVSRGNFFRIAEQFQQSSMSVVRNDRYGSGLSGREDLAHLLIDVKRRLHGGSSVCVGWSVV